MLYAAREPANGRPADTNEALLMGGLVGSVGLRALRRPCGSCACLVARSCARARAASNTATCCSARAWCRTLARRRYDRLRTACSVAGASGPMRPGTSPLPRRSHPFGRDRRTGGRSGGPALHVVRTASGSGSFRSVNIVWLRRCEARFALVQEGSHAFPLVGRAEQPQEQLAFACDAGRAWCRDRGVDR